MSQSAIPTLLLVPPILCFVVAMRFGARDAIALTVLFNAAALLYWYSIPVMQPWGRLGASFIYKIVTATTIAGVLLGLVASLLVKRIRTGCGKRRG